MPDYLFPHPKAGWRYHRAVPRALQRVLGRKAWVRYIHTMPRAQALAEARRLAIECDQEIARYSRLSAAERQEIVARGGLDAIEIAADDTGAVFVEAVAIHTEVNLDADDVTVAREARLIAEARKAAAAMRATAAPAKALLARLTGDRRTGLEDLVVLWERMRAPRHARTSKRVRKSVALLAEIIGHDVTPTRLTQAHIIKFRDNNADSGMSEIMQAKHLAHIRAVLSVAVSEGVMGANPAAGVRARKDPARKLVHEKMKRRPFSPEQLRFLLERAEAVRWGEARHADVMWVLRLLVFTGARLNEVAQLRREDVRVESGVAVIAIHDEGEGQRVKNKASIRKVPLHPAVIDFLDYAAKARPGERVFQSLTYYSEGGWGGWLTRNFATFRRNVCGIHDSRVVLHSIRHSFVDAARNAGIHEEVCRAIVGHAGVGVHAKYGQGAGLKVLARAISKIDPLAG